MILGFFSDMGKFFSDNPWYLVIVIAVLIIAIAVAFAISGLKKKGEKKQKAEGETPAAADEPKEEPAAETPAGEEKAEPVAAEKEAEKEAEAAPAADGKNTEQQETEKPADAPADAEEKTEKNYAEENIYHVTRRKEDGKWQVKLQKGDKAIKLFNTQEEAYAYAKKIAGNKEGTVHLHKVYGQNRKYK